MECWGGSLSEITLYSGHTSAPKVASQFSPWKNPESNVSSNYLLFALSFCKHIEKFLWLGEEKNISEIRNNNQNNKLSPNLKVLNLTLQSCINLSFHFVMFIFKVGEHWKWFQICGRAPGVAVTPSAAQANFLSLTTIYRETAQNSKNIENFATLQYSLPTVHSKSCPKISWILQQ